MPCAAQRRTAQSRAGSLAEATANVVVGYALALLVQMIAYPALGVRTSMTTNAALALVFSLVSLARSFVLRRVFEHLGR